MAKTVVVIGAGPAGLTAARYLAQRRLDVQVLEQDPDYVGGISRTTNYKGYRFDIGGHRFYSKNKEIEDLWTEVLGDDMLVRPRLSRIYYNGKFYDYPLKAWNAFSNLGPAETFRCLASYMKAKIAPRRSVTSFEDWVIDEFGFRLYTMFFKAYTEKVWGIPCTQLSADWAAQRIRGLSLSSVITSVLGLKAGKPDRTRVIKTLIDSFRYPKYGPGMLWERIRSEIEMAGGHVTLDRRVVRIKRAAGNVVVRAVDSSHSYFDYDAEQVISTMPMRDLVGALQPNAPEHVKAAADVLRYRDFLTVALVIRKTAVFPDNWIYIHDPEVRVGRIQNFKNWSPFMVPDTNTTCLGMEYFTFEGGELWTMADKDLIQMASQEVVRLGFVSAEEVVDGVVARVKKAYPVYDDHYVSSVRMIRELLLQEWPEVLLAGRNGMHKYDNQDHAMLTGLICARRIADNSSMDPWHVNADAEYQEEVVTDDRSGRLQPELLQTHGR